MSARAVPKGFILPCHPLSAQSAPPQGASRGYSAFLGCLFHPGQLLLLGVEDLITNHTGNVIVEKKSCQKQGHGCGCVTSQGFFPIPWHQQQRDTRNRNQSLGFKQEFCKNPVFLDFFPSCNVHVCGCRDRPRIKET